MRQEHESVSSKRTGEKMSFARLMKETINRLACMAVILPFLVGLIIGFSTAVIYPGTSNDLRKVIKKSFHSSKSHKVKKHTKVKSGSFSNKNEGKKVQSLTKEEQATYKGILSRNKAFIDSLSSAEKASFSAIEQKIKRLVSTDSHIKIVYKESLDPKEMIVATKIKRFQKVESKRLSKMEKKLHNRILRKLSQQQLMEVYLYVKM